jgi:hypothetical protein
MQLHLLTGLARAKHSKMGSFSGRPAGRSEKKRVFGIRQILEASCFMISQKNYLCLEVAFDVWGAKLVSPAGVAKLAASIAMSLAS